ncbi:MAG: hypothetical protein IJM41_07505 [Bacteroidales bacterium]|nr:hypothetical protein [Bacteroidales bacterium]
MRHNIISICLILMAVVFSVASCKEPPSREKFILAEDSVFGRYDFDVDMTDTTRTYDLTLYTRLDGADLPDSLPVSISFVSPGGAVTESELVFFSSGAQLVDSSYFSRGLKVPYIQDFLPQEGGIWKLSVYARPAAYLRGFGLVAAHH